jgi:hypothetical protein
MSTFRSPCRALVVGAVLSSSAACDMSQDREAEWLALAQDQQERAEAQRAERAEAEQALFALISEPGEPLRIEEEAELHLVLEFYCGECHRKVVSTSVDGWWFESLEDLIESGKIVPGDAERSRLVERLRAGEMPPPSAGDPPVPVAVIDAIAELIDSLPVPLPPEVPEPPPPPPPPLPVPEPIPVPGVGNDRCHFEYLGDWIRCENAGEVDSYTLQNEGALEDCFEACLAQPDCASVTDYSWLGRPDLGCDLYISTCDAPSRGDWHEEDAGKEYRKVCAAE